MANTAAFGKAYSPLLSAYIQKNLVAKTAVNFKWQPYARQNQSVSIRRLSSVNVYDYVKDTPENELSSSAVSFTNTDLILDKAKYSIVTIDPILVAQSNIEMFTPVAQSMGYEFAQVQDSAILGTYTSFNTGNMIQSGSSRLIVDNPSTVTAATSSAYRTAVDLKVKLDQAHAPKGDRYLLANSTFIANMLNDTNFKQFDASVQATGMIGNVAGFTVLETENIPDASNGAKAVLAVHKSAITFASSLSFLKSHEGKIQTSAVGMVVYGYEVIEPSRGAVAFVTY